MVQGMAKKSATLFEKVGRCTKWLRFFFARETKASDYNTFVHLLCSRGLTALQSRAIARRAKKRENFQEIFVIFPLDNNEVAPVTDLGDYVFACQLM